MAIRSNCLAFSRGSGRFHDRFSGDWSQLLPDPAHRGSLGGLLSLSLINRYVQVITTGLTLSGQCFEVKFSITCKQTFYFLKFFSLPDQKILKLLFLYENNKADLKAYRFVNFFLCCLLLCWWYHNHFVVKKFTEIYSKFKLFSNILINELD